MLCLVCNAEYDNRLFFITHLKHHEILKEIVFQELIFSSFNSFIHKLSIFIQYTTLRKLNQNIETDEVLDLIQFFGNINQPFSFADTKYKQMKYIKETGNYVEPVSVSFGFRTDTGLRNNQSCIIKKPVTFEYVSIYDSLRRLVTVTPEIRCD